MHNLKRYILFTGNNYYPAGGTNDITGFYSTLTECVNNIGRADWWNAYDTQTNIIIKTYISGPDLIKWAEDYDAMYEEEE